MCFSIPYKILKIDKNTAFLEGGKSVRIDDEFDFKKDDYLQISGDAAVSGLKKNEGKKIRRLIKKLYDG